MCTFKSDAIYIKAQCTSMDQVIKDQLKKKSWILKKMGHQILGLEMAYNYSLKPTIKNVYECRQQVKLFYFKGITFKIYDIFQKLQL